LLLHFVGLEEERGIAEVQLYPLYRILCGQLLKDCKLMITRLWMS